MKGLTHIYTGDGKGKTTAAVGLAVRAVGDGFRVLLVQFLKGRKTGELEPLEKLGVEIVRAQNVVKFIPQMTPEEFAQCKDSHESCLKAAKNAAGKYGLIILDEVIGAVQTGMIGAEELLNFVKTKPEELELVLTGRDAPPELLALADYVSEIRCVRHPYEKGVPARKGIEY